MLNTMLAVVLAAPQGPPPTQSLLMDMPITVMRTGAPSELMLSEADGGLVPMSQVDPRFEIASIVAVPSEFRINSFSRGTGAMFSRMPSAGHVHPVVSSMGWSFMVFSVSGGNWAPGSAYAMELAAPGSIEGDVFGYILEGSDSSFPAEQIGTVHKIREGGEIGLGPLADIDTYLSGYAATDDYVADAEANMGIGALRFYFTLRRIVGSDYSDIPDSWGPSGTAWKAPSTIFEVKWDPSGFWQTPTVFKTASDLGLDSSMVINALSVMDPDIVGAPHDMKGIEVLLSTEDGALGPSDLAHQLWVSGTWTSDDAQQQLNYSGPLKDASGGLFVVSALRFNDGTQQRIDAFCGDDPGGDVGSSVHHRLRQERMAFLRDASGNERLDSSLHQIRWPAGAQFTRYRATFQGFVGPTDNYAMLRIVGPFRDPVPPILVLRDPTDPYLDKQAVELQLPRLGGGGEPVRLQWSVHDAAGRFLGVSHEFEILVR